MVGNPVLSVRNMLKSLKFCDRVLAIVVRAIIY